MTVVDGAAADDKIAAGDAVAASVFVFARFDADGVVSHVEGRVEQHYPVAGVYVYAVSVGGIMGVADGYILDSDVFAPKGMKVPGGGVLEGDALQQHSLALAQRYKHGAEEGFNFLLVELV